MADDKYTKIQDIFGGEWKLDRSENFDEFLKKMGVNMVTRKMISSATPTCKISVKDGKITVSMITSLKTKTEEFQLGEPFETEAMGEKGKVVASFDGEKLRTEPTADTKKKIPKTFRYVAGGEMCLEFHVEDVTCKRYFKKVN